VASSRLEDGSKESDRVEDVMLRRPKRLPSSATVGDVRAFFQNPARVSAKTHDRRAGAARVMSEVVYRPIGVVRSSFTTLEGMPLHSAAAADVHGTIELDPSFADGLRDLDGFSHLHLITHLHQGRPDSLIVTPFLDDSPRGVFATRSPRHPNPIGLSIVRLERVEGTTLHITGSDLLDGTPVLDLKPYVPAFDSIQTDRIGWFAGKTENIHHLRADGRFDTQA
jgi:tRNA-Thr(GGU) m(6)t(6)A37 methyltransferase TsaA